MSGGAYKYLARETSTAIYVTRCVRYIPPDSGLILPRVNFTALVDTITETERTVTETLWLTENQTETGALDWTATGRILKNCDKLRLELRLHRCD